MAASLISTKKRINASCKSLIGCAVLSTLLGSANLNAQVISHTATGKTTYFGIPSEGDRFAFGWQNRSTPNQSAAHAPSAPGGKKSAGIYRGAANWGNGVAPSAFGIGSAGNASRSPLAPGLYKFVDSGGRVTYSDSTSGSSGASAAPSAPAMGVPKIPSKPPIVIGATPVPAPIPAPVPGASGPGPTTPAAAPSPAPAPVVGTPVATAPSPVPAPAPTPAPVPLPPVATAPPSSPAPTPGGSTSSPLYPASQIVTTQPALITLPRPPYLQPTALPGLNTSVTRITDASAFSSDRIQRHIYAKIQPWNSDGSLILLTATNPWSFLDGKTFKRLGTAPVPSQAIWSNTDPDLIYGIGSFSPAIFTEYRVSTNVRRTLRTWPEYSELHIGGFEGNLSNDSRYVALFGKRAGAVDVLVYDIPNNVVVSKKAFSGVTAPYGDLDWVSVSPSGAYVVVNVQKPAQAFDVYDTRTMAFLRRVPGGATHTDLGYDSAGNEVLVTTTGSSAITSVRLADGVTRTELPASHMTWNFHISCRNIARPGYCYVSTYVQGGSTAYMYREIYALKLDGSGRVERFAQNFAADLPVDLQYWRSAMAVPNRDGSLVLFASDWRDPSAAAVIHTYVAGVR